MRGASPEETQAWPGLEGWAPTCLRALGGRGVSRATEPEPGPQEKEGLGLRRSPAGWWPGGVGQRTQRGGGRGRVRRKGTERAPETVTVCGSPAGLPGDPRSKHWQGLRGPGTLIHRRSVPCARRWGGAGGRGRGGSRVGDGRSPRQPPPTPAPLNPPSPLFLLLRCCLFSGLCLRDSFLQE